MEQPPKLERDLSKLGCEIVWVALDNVDIKFWRIAPEEAEALGQQLPRFGEEVLGPEF